MLCNSEAGAENLMKFLRNCMKLKGKERKQEAPNKEFKLSSLDPQPAASENDHRRLKVLASASEIDQLGSSIGTQRSTWLTLGFQVIEQRWRLQTPSLRLEHMRWSLRFVLVHLLIIIFVMFALVRWKGRNNASYCALYLRVAIHQLFLEIRNRR